MSELDEAMFKHIDYLVNVERRPFTFKDFVSFYVDGKEYHMKHGTFRNKISILKKLTKVEVVFNSAGLTFYTLKGVIVGKQIPSNHMGVSYTNPFYHFIKDLILNNNSIHDIHLKFKSKDIWSIFSFSSNPTFKLNSISKDIRLGRWKIIDNNSNNTYVIVLVTVHRTNTVTVVIGCSCNPFPLDISGIIDLSNVLARIEERINMLIQTTVNDIIFNNKSIGEEELPQINIPSYKEWIVCQWHFGADSVVEYSGEKFSMKWKTAENIMIQAYSKVFKNRKCRIRLERHESPNKRFFEAIEEKLYDNNSWFLK
jgi:hypothetical protein